MISVITIIEDEHSECLNNIKKTSGIKDIEVISIIKNDKNIGKIYNNAIKNSSYDIIVFCNENIKILTKNA